MSISTVTIESLGPMGDGIARLSKRILFIENALPKEKIKVKTFTDKKGKWRGEVLEIIERSPLRVAPPCSHFSQCGGCTLQHLELTAYQKWKISKVKDFLFSQNIKARTWKDPIFINQEKRRRVNFSLFLDKKEIKLGYFKRRTKEVFAVENCLVSLPEVFNIRHELITFFKKNNWNKKIDISLQKGDRFIDMVITGEIKKLSHFDFLVSNTPIRRVSQRNHYFDSPTPIFNCDKITTTFGTLKVNLPPASFLQATLDGEKALVAETIQSIGKADSIADLFCGIGTFTGPLLSLGRVEAYESNASSVQALKEAGKGKKLRVFQRDLFKQPLNRAELSKYDAIVFNPPRLGAERQASLLSKCNAKTIVGISCNPDSFSRDAKLITNGNFYLHSVLVVDQFLWSDHVELIGVFKRKQ